VGADLAGGLDVARLDLVVSNPPYIAAAEVASLPVEVREHEPREALVAGPTGLEAYKRLVSQLGALRPGTPLVLEVGAGQAEAVAALLEDAGFVHVRTIPDYAGIPRVVIGRRAPWTASTS
jgi:release factor glutamine methyltransferase